MTNLPEPLPPRQPALHPAPLLRAAVSPGAVALVAAGAAIGVLVFHAWVVAVILAFAGWSGRMAAAVVAERRREQAARPRPAELDPWSVPEPWRPLVQQAADAQRRFDQAVDGWRSGPLRDRLVDLQPRVWSDVAELGAMARRGAAMTGWTGASAGGRPSADALSAELRRITAERESLGPGSPDRADSLDRREEALASQLRAVRRSEQAAAELLDRMRSAVAALEHTVTDLLALEGRTEGPDSVFASLQTLSDEVSALRAAVAETAGTPGEPPAP